ncbi:zf-C2H2_jaz domain-containing protein/zf-C2H2_4 domain-containing protein [Cephalotus follicularis]|uniref:Zf-C2H2_jaz domain-containing protein/zf-C2H2_4 domain-containing protein n=1 Tax=Cephalotus follicularis TaxID=3775 RepID=A0A1Q3CT12_CEPFO|nr:zf-C2H2_jaz domain-containing protein/zf-C2H2_4 domain-containing protein [Cephalotus follicularis]
MSNITPDDGSFSSGNTGEEVLQQTQEKQQMQNHFHGSSSFPPSGAINSNGSSLQQQQAVKKKRNLPGTPDPNAEVIALSPTTLMATNRFVCEICNKGFQRDQNLQLHRRGHNLPWKLKQKSTSDVRKRVYTCPEASCVHHNPARALGDLTGIKKHFSRKHGEKKWKCDKCSKKYAVKSDWKAHQKTCGTKDYNCECGTIFSRRDSFITHRAFCDALAEDNNDKVNQGQMTNIGPNLQNQMSELISSMPMNGNTSTANGVSDFNNLDTKNPLKSLPQELMTMPFKSMNMGSSSSSTLFGGPRSISSSSSSLQLRRSNSSSGFNHLQDSKKGSHIPAPVHMSATALLAKAAEMGAATASNNINSPMMQKSFVSSVRPSSIGTIQQHINSYDRFPSQPDQSNIVGINGRVFTNHLLQQKEGQEDTSQMFDTGAGSSSMNDMGMFSSMYMGGDQNQGFLRNMEHEVSGNSPNMMQGRAEIECNHTLPSRFGGSDDGGGGGDMMTRDFMGINGGSRPMIFYEELQQQQQQQRIMELEAMSHHQRLSKVGLIFN